MVRTCAPWPPTTVPASHAGNGFLRPCPRDTPSSRSPWKAPWSQSSAGRLALPHTSRWCDVVCASERGRSLTWVSLKALTQGTGGETRPEPGLLGPPAPARSLSACFPGNDPLSACPKDHGKRIPGQPVSFTRSHPRGQEVLQNPGSQVIRAPATRAPAPGAVHLQPALDPCWGLPPLGTGMAGPRYRQRPTRCLQPCTWIGLQPL